MSETIATHEYESKVLAPAFTAITGIKVTHDLIGEGDVVEKLQTQMQTGENIYDAYINDSDLIGTHWRYQQARNLTDWMAGEGTDVTNPDLDLDDFIGLSSPPRRTASSTSCPTSSSRTSTGSATTGSTTRRPRTISRPSTAMTSAFRSTGRPMRTSPSSSPVATCPMGGPATGVYGNMDYGKKDPSLGWRYTDAWMSMAGMGDVGEPNGLPVDEWGIRVDENSRPVGSCVARGGATNDAAAVYAVTKAIEWLQKYSPPEAQGMTFGEAGPVPAQGAHCPADVLVHRLHRRHRSTPGTPVMNEDGTPKWRMAPSPHGVYWQDGQKVGYQDVGSWTLMKSTPDRPCQGRLALRAVRHLEDRRPEEDPCRSDLHP